MNVQNEKKSGRLVGIADEDVKREQQLKTHLTRYKNKNKMTMKKKFHQYNFYIDLK